MQDLDLTSTMGHTVLKMYGTTVGEFLKGDPKLGTASRERVELLRSHVWQRLHDPENPDHIRVFVKSEPHKAAKLEEGRYRLISAISIVDTVADRVMFRWLAKSVMEAVGLTPSMVGLSPLGGGYRWIWKLFEGKKTRALDMTAWDWTIPPWLLIAMKDLVKKLAVGAPDFWNDWVDRRWEALFAKAVFVFADGTTVQQPGWGVMKSGCYLTIILNTLAQVVRHNLVLSMMKHIPVKLTTVFLGDDQTIEDFPEFEEYERVTRSLGFLLKDSVVQEDEVHFIGYIMSRSSFRPEYEKKHVYKITHTPDHLLPETLSSYVTLYAYQTDWFDWINLELARVSPRSVRSRRALLEILSGEPVIRVH